MAKKNILASLGKIIAGISSKKPEAVKPDTGTTNRVLEGSDAPDNAQALTAALRQSGGGQAAASSSSPAVGPSQTQSKASNAGAAVQRKAQWLSGVVSQHKEKLGAAREAIGRAGAGDRPTRQEGVQEIAGMNRSQRIERLKNEGMSVSQRTGPEGKETMTAALLRVEGALLQLREKEQHALGGVIAATVKFGSRLAVVGALAKTLFKLDLASRGAMEVTNQWSDGLLASKENLQSYSGVVASGLAEMNASQMNLQVQRGITTGDANASFMRQKKGFNEAMAPMQNDFENLKTRMAAIGLFFMKWGARIIYFISPITYLSKGVEVIADFFGFGSEDEEAPPVLYMQFLQMVADGKFEGAHAERPADK
jgi:hypothetical protein